MQSTSELSSAASLAMNFESLGSDELRAKVYRSLERIERTLLKRDPAALLDIYNSVVLNDLSNTNQNALIGMTRYAQPPPSLEKIERSTAEKRTRLNFKQKRVAQDQINLKVVEHLKIPKGVALRGLLLPSVPDILFSSECPDNWSCESGSAFQWLETNVSNAEQSARRNIAREEVKKSLDNWVFMYFRVLRRNWEIAVINEKKHAPDVNVYTEDYINKWTLKLRFKILKIAPLKVAVDAFLSRMGLEDDPNIVFARDGFFGLMDVGNMYGDNSSTPSARLSLNTSPLFLGFKNGDNIFVRSVETGQAESVQNVKRSSEPRRDGQEKAEADADAIAAGGEAAN